MITCSVLLAITFLLIHAISEDVQERNHHETAISKRSARCWFREEYLTCGSACPETCENYGLNVSCTKQCVSGCFCRKGYVRDTRSRYQNCILPEHCTNPPVCNRPGEHFSKCGTHCPLTCDNVDEPPVCIMSCAVGCFCVEGLVRNEKGICVHPKDCPMTVPKVCSTEGEILDPCGCETKCTGKRNYYVKHCPNYCIESCVCKPGLARHPTNGSCIIPRFCPEVI